MIVPFFAVTRLLFQNNYRSNGVQRNNQLCQIVRKESVNQFHNASFTNLYLKFRHHFNSTQPPFKRKFIMTKWNFHLSQICEILKSNPVEVAKTCVKHIEFVLAQRIRRGQQMITLYTRLWDEKALRQFFLKMKRTLNRKGKQFIIGCSILAFDWENERISIEELERWL